MIGEITTFFGLRVFTDEGRYIGKVEDVIIDPDARMVRGLALVDYNKGVINSRAKGIIIPYRIVKAVGDIIIVRDVFKRPKRVRYEEEFEEEVIAEEQEV
jgi:sporulation protein YlmC with PRC-barrel domain